MAKHRYFKRAKRAYKGMKRYARRTGKSEGLVGTLLPAAIYGAIRAPAANLMQPVTAMIPLGGYADEAALALAGYLLAKNTSGWMQKVGKTAVIVEAASVASQMTAGMTGSKGTAGYVYG